MFLSFIIFFVETLFLKELEERLRSKNNPERIDRRRARLATSSLFSWIRFEWEIGPGSLGGIYVDDQGHAQYRTPNEAWEGKREREREIVASLCLSILVSAKTKEPSFPLYKGCMHASCSCACSSDTHNFYRSRYVSADCFSYENWRAIKRSNGFQILQILYL